MELPSTADIAEGVRRRCARGGGLSNDLARVLAAVVTRVADGEEMPTQDVLAAELGMTRRTFGAAVARLGRDHGFILLQRTGQAVGKYHVLWMQIAEWAALDIRCAETRSDVRSEHIGTEKGPDAHARGSSSSSSTSSPPPSAPPSPSTSPTPRVLTEAEKLERAKKIARSAGTHVPQSVWVQVQELLNRGYTLEDFKAAAVKVGEQGSPAWKYYRHTLEEAPPSGPVNMVPRLQAAGE